MLIITSPGIPPFLPALPFPFTPSLSPSYAPGGITVVFFTLLRTSPAPLQVWQGFFIILPEPRHVWHVVVEFIIMPRARLCVVTVPEPPHVWQVSGTDPAAAPEPEHTSQVSILL
jgi:hypothetical protein